MTTTPRAAEAQPKIGTIHQRLLQEVEQACHLAVEYERPGELLGLLETLNAQPGLPIPYGRVLRMLRMALTDLTLAGQNDLANLLYAIERYDEVLYMESAAELFDGDAAEFVDAIVRRNCYPEDLGERRAELVAELQKRWGLAPEMSS